MAIGRFWFSPLSGGTRMSSFALIDSRSDLVIQEKAMVLSPRPYHIKRRKGIASAREEENGINGGRYEQG